MVDIGPWGKKFVASHILIGEYKVNGSWDNIPPVWSNIRFDALDVLHISPFFVSTANHTFQLSTVDGGSLQKRFEWVIAAARTQNPNIRIVLEQFYGKSVGQSAFDNVPRDDTQATTFIKTYAASVATFIGGWYNKTLPKVGTPGDVGRVSARIDGYEVDVEGNTEVTSLPKILTAVRGALNTLANDINKLAPQNPSHPQQPARFAVSISPFRAGVLNDTVPAAVDYVNTQDYSGGRWGDHPGEFTRAMPSIKPWQLIWGICSEEPYRSQEITWSFDGVKAKAKAVVDGQASGIWTWRLGSDVHAWENVFQVWLYNTVHGVTLPNSKTEQVVRTYWPWGARKEGVPPLTFDQMVPLDAAGAQEIMTAGQHARDTSDR